MTGVTTFAGVVVHEGRMAVRGRVLWLSMIPAVLLVALLGLASPVVGGLPDPVARIGTWAMLMTTFCAPALAVGLADRFARMLRREPSGMAELLASTPGSSSVRMAGMLAGPLAVGLVPVAAGLALVCGSAAVTDGRATALLGAGLVAMATIIVPGALVATALGTLLALLVPTTLARVIVVAVWFWSTHLNPQMFAIPTVTRTLFSPLGGYPAAAWLHVGPTWARLAPGVLSPPPTPAAALLSVALVLAAAVVFGAAARAVCALRG